MRQATDLKRGRKKPKKFTVNKRKNTTDSGLNLENRKIWRGVKLSEKNVKKIRKSLKKHLTFKRGYGIIFKLSQESSPMKYQGKRIRQKS